MGAASRGPSVALVAELILADRAVDGLRPVRVLIRLADTYTTARLEVACRRAVRFATPTYRSVKDILAGGLDRLPEELPDEPTNKYGGRVVARVQLLDDSHVSSRRGGAAKTRCSRVCRATPPAFFSDWLHAGRGDGRLIPTRRENAVTRSSHADSQDCGNDVVTAGWSGPVDQRLRGCSRFLSARNKKRRSSRGRRGSSRARDITRVPGPRRPESARRRATPVPRWRGGSGGRDR